MKFATVSEWPSTKNAGDKEKYEIAGIFRHIVEQPFSANG